MTKAIVRLTIILAGTFLGIMLASSAASAHETTTKTTVKVNKPAATAVTYRVAAFEDGSARIVRRVHKGNSIVKVNTWKVDEGTILPRTCSTVVLQGKGIPHTIAATYCPTVSTTRMVATRIATDEDVEGDTHYDVRDPRTSTLPLVPLPIA